MPIGFLVGTVGNQLKESVIGIEVFGRRPDYDVRQDSIVRTEAGKLRARLAKYYATEGAAGQVVIDLPKGGYRPVFRNPEVTWRKPLLHAGQSTGGGNSECRGLEFGRGLWSR